VRRPGNSDETVLLKRSGFNRPGPRRPGKWMAVAGVLLVAVLAVLAWFALRPGRKPEFAIRSATEAQILADRPVHLTVFRFAPDPKVVVLDFPGLEQQGLMLDRVAALVEKKNLPRDRVLTDAELAAAITAADATVATYYYGHDYRAADLARFFRLAARDHVGLNPEEQRLRRLMRQLGWLSRPGWTAGAIITIPAVEPAAQVGPGMRKVILHHELSHGFYFTSAAYAAYVKHVWQTVLTRAQRQDYRRFLSSEDYDPAETDLIMNEMQAYTMFTPDPRFFTAAAVGMTQAALTRLQIAFRQGMPRGWLRDGAINPGALAR